MGRSNTHDERVGGAGRKLEHLLHVFAAVSIGRPRLSGWRQRDCSDLSEPHPLQTVSSHKMVSGLERHYSWLVKMILPSSGWYSQLAVNLKRHFCALTQYSLVLVVGEAATTELVAPLLG